MNVIRLDGRFTVKEGAEGELSLVYEAGPGPLVFLSLGGPASTSMKEAHELADAINMRVSEVVLDFSYSPQSKLGFGPV
jgi:hypothetical protein